MASSSKELKARLKAAKAAVGKKDFQEVYKLCLEYISSLKMCANLKWAYQSPPTNYLSSSYWVYGVLIPQHTNTTALVADKTLLYANNGSLTSLSPCIDGERTVGRCRVPCC